jgi:CRP/FNR family cyclic AMP-dependent transcriptional regulator
MKKALYLLAQFSDRDFEWLLREGKRVAIPSGTLLIREGEATDALYIVLDGALSVSVDALGEETIAELGSGELIGEMSFVDSRPPSATVKAIADSSVWAIPRFKLTAKLMQDVEFASHFYHAVAVFLSDRLRDTVSRLGYSKDSPPNAAEDLNPQVIGSLELAKARLDWLLSRLKEAP